MIDRRKFLERSVLGAGSVLFSSALLQSCTKYGIPLPGGIPHPGGGGTPPPLTSEIDWSDASKTAVTTGLGMKPEAGEILAGLVDIFWPRSPQDVWGQVRAQSEEIVNQKIAFDVYLQVKEDLEDLHVSTVLYLMELKNGTPGEILSHWMITRTKFVTALPHFQSAGNELPLLGLFGQFANMFLALLRDAVISGQSWGRTDAEHQQDIQDLKTAIKGFVYYVNFIHIPARSTLQSKTATNDLTNEPFNTVNKFDRQMTLTVLDFRDTWKYYDVTQYPVGTTVVLTREIYSDPMGSIKDTNNPNIDIPLPAPTQRPTKLSLWGVDNRYNNSGIQVAAVQVTYPLGSGPFQVTTTPRMGVQHRGSNQPPYGALVNISHDNPVVAVQCTYAQRWVDSFQLTFDDGTMINVGGTGDKNPTATANLTFYSERMSSIYITGVGIWADAAACIVFGFQNWQSPSATLRAIQHLYVTSPKERLAADFAKAFPNVAIPAGLITYELKAARLAHWADIEVRAKEHK